MIHVQEAFKAYPKDKITDIWASYFNNLRGIMKETGGNQYKPAHNDSRNRRKETGSPIDLSVNLEDYISCLDFLFISNVGHNLLFVLFNSSLFPNLSSLTQSSLSNVLRPLPLFSLWTGGRRSSM